MAMRNRIRITTQTDRVLIIRRRRTTRLWCPECGREMEMIDAKAAEVLTGVKPPIRRDHAEAHGWHSSQGHDGSPLVCLESVLKWIERPGSQ